MEYRRLGKSGLKLSALSFGSWVTFKNQVGENDALEMMKIAYDAGVNFFDNAEAYASGVSEEIMGKALRQAGWGRDTYCVSSKVFWGGKKPTQMGLSRKHVTEACHAALRRLQVDYLDLYFCHRFDAETPIEETVRAMHDLVTQGKVLYWGTSEWRAADIKAAHRIARTNGLTPPTMEQPQYNLFHRKRVEREYGPLYGSIGLGTTTWSPLASGILTGKYSEGIPENSRGTLPAYDDFKKILASKEGKSQIEKTRKLEKLASEWGVPVSTLAIAWCMKNPHVTTVILGASRATQLKDNLKAAVLAPQLTKEMMRQIAKAVG